jgi:predicted dehydrogenase
MPGPSRGGNSVRNSSSTPVCPLNVAILGCGARGRIFSDWILRHPEQARVVAVAEPKPDRRNALADQHQIAAGGRFENWESLLAQPRLAELAINTTMDQQHVASAIAALDRGYHMLLEKPMAVTLKDCIAIDDARRRNERIVSVCHSLRYHLVYAQVKKIIDAGTLGKVISIDQLEGVEPQHQAHSFVRGNWGNEARSSFMLLQKSCHDVDLISYLVGEPCERVSSFGSLSHFTKANEPAGATARCVDGCKQEPVCPYSARKIYLEDTPYAEVIGLTTRSPQERMEFIKTTSYGRCAYDMDNDVVDHQVVNFQFAGGATATFTMTAFAPGNRKLRVHGTRGYLEADLIGRTIDLTHFWGENPPKEHIEVPPQEGGHGGSDGNVMARLVAAIQQNDPSLVLTGTDESLRTHAVTFAAELSRREKRIVEMKELLR